MAAMQSPDPLFLAFQNALAGRYSIDREIGRGGMGIVYLAREVHLDRLVAIKLLPPERAEAPDLRDRFLREARLAAKLSHPNIIPIHSVEESAGFVFFVMAFVDGITLAERVRTRGPLSGSDGARIIREVAWALAHAHSQGLVHRDVKPDNILIENGSGRVLVADFGIAAAAGAVSVEDSGITGTPEFMSPEQALGMPLDARSDVYGLGATAYYALSGRLAIEGDTATEVIAKQISVQHTALASLGIGVPRRVAHLIDRCLAKDPDDRPASAEALAQQMSTLLEQRREVPAALRAFVKRSGRIDGGGTLIFSLLLMFGSSAVSAVAGSKWGFAALITGATLVPFTYLVSVARRLTRLGFSHADVAPAFDAELEQAREERAVERRAVPRWMERLLASSARISAVVAVGTGAATFGQVFTFEGLFGAAFPLGTFAAAFGISATAALASTIGFMAVAQRRRDIDTEFWARIWRSRLGRAVFAVARRLRGNQPASAAMTHRATELALGMAAEQLFDSLPRETRESLGDLPQLLQRLQRDAQVLRRHLNSAQDALSDLGNESKAPGVSDIRLHRDELHDQLAGVVGALETVRLNLLRLHAGSLSIENLTTHLAAAEEVSAHVQRLIASHAEVEKELRFPRDIASTPA